MAIIVRIKVTQADIDLGSRRCPSWCPIALAIERALPRSQPSVGARTFSVQMPGKHDRVGNLCLPYEAQRFVAAFDDAMHKHEVVKPFEFDLLLPDAEWEPARGK